MLFFVPIQLFYGWSSFFQGFQGHLCETFFDSQGQDLWQPCLFLLFFVVKDVTLATGGLCFPFHGNTTEEDTFINLCTVLLQIRKKNRNCIPLMFQTHFIDVQSRPMKVPQKLRKTYHILQVDRMTSQTGQSNQ